MAFKLTKTKVDSIPHPKSGQKFYRDSLLVGFGLRVGKSSKAYYAEKRVDGKTVRKTIGNHGQITTEQARKEAQRLLGIMATGQNPNDVKKQEKAKAITLKEAFDEFLETRKSLKPRTIYDYKRVMEFCFKNWQKKLISEISKDMVTKRHAQIGKESGGAYANLAMRVLRAVFNFAIAQYEDSEGNSIISENPVKRLSQTRAWYRVDRRNTVIKSHDLPAFFEGINQLQDTALTNKAEVVRDYILLLLFTGLRRQEAAKLRWDQVDFKAQTFTVTDTKNHEPLTLPLSDYLLTLLKARQEKRVNDYVFPGDGENGYIVEPRRQMAKVTKISGVSFTLHDLRRTFITIAESLDISSYAVKRLINHKMSGDVTAGYIIADVERLRKPMQQITDYILRTAGVKAKAEVIELGSRRKG
jgi:integrase